MVNGDSYVPSCFHILNIVVKTSHHSVLMKIKRAGHALKKLIPSRGLDYRKIDYKLLHLEYTSDTPSLIKDGDESETSATRPPHGHVQGIDL